jgi:CHAT domain
VVAYLFQHGHLVGWAQTSPTVVPPGSPLPTGLATAAAIPLGRAVGAPPDLTLTLTRAGDARYLDWGFGSPHPVELPRTRVTTDLEQDDARAFAHDAVLSVAQTEPGFIRMKLAGVSKVIGGRIPSETWRTLESVTPFATAEGRTPVLLVVSEEPYVPWDLAMVPEALRLDPESPPLLGCQMVTGRWMPPDAADGLNPGHPKLPPPVDVDVASMAVVVHRADGGAAPLPAALEEAERLRNEYGAVVVPARVDEVAALLEERYRAGGPVVLPDVLHLACHGEADPASPSRSGLLLWAGPGNWTSLSPDVLRGAPLVGDRHPFVFINACEAGTPLQGLDGFGGLVGACLKEGARGVIAPLWKVGDRPAGQVATGFYEHVLAGTDRAGDAMRLLRSGPHHDEPVWDRDLLAYTYFGHPMLRLVGHDLID